MLDPGGDGDAFDDAAAGRNGTAMAVDAPAPAAAPPPTNNSPRRHVRSNSDSTVVYYPQWPFLYRHRSPRPMQVDEPEEEEEEEDDDDEDEDEDPEHPSAAAAAALHASAHHHDSDSPTREAARLDAISGLIEMRASSTMNLASQAGPSWNPSSALGMGMELDHTPPHSGSPGGYLPYTGFQQHHPRISGSMHSSETIAIPALSGSQGSSGSSNFGGSSSQRLSPSVPPQSGTGLSPTNSSGSYWRTTSQQATPSKNGGTALQVSPLHSLANVSVSQGYPYPEQQQQQQQQQQQVLYANSGRRGRGGTIRTGGSTVRTGSVASDYGPPLSVTRSLTADIAGGMPGPARSSSFSGTSGMDSSAIFSGIRFPSMATLPIAVPPSGSLAAARAIEGRPRRTKAGSGPSPVSSSPSQQPIGEFALSFPRTVDIFAGITPPDQQSHLTAAGGSLGRPKRMRDDELMQPRRSPSTSSFASYYSQVEEPPTASVERIPSTSSIAREIVPVPGQLDVSSLEITSGGRPLTSTTTNTRPNSYHSTSSSVGRTPLEKLDAELSQLSPLIPPSSRMQLLFSYAFGADRSDTGMSDTSLDPREARWRADRALDMLKWWFSPSSSGEEDANPGKEDDDLVGGIKWMMQVRPEIWGKLQGEMMASSGGVPGALSSGGLGGIGGGR